MSGGVGACVWVLCSVCVWCGGQRRSLEDCKGLLVSTQVSIQMSDFPASSSAQPVPGVGGTGVAHCRLC